jgi:hypothetical protein
MGRPHNLTPATGGLETAGWILHSAAYNLVFAIAMAAAFRFIRHDLLAALAGAAGYVVLNPPLRGERPACRANGGRGLTRHPSLQNL